MVVEAHQFCFDSFWLLLRQNNKHVVHLTEPKVLEKRHIKVFS
jgi:hypothetical protein